MNLNYDLIIGIDPDVDKSGVACLCVKTKKMVLLSYSLIELYEYLKKVKFHSAVEDDKVVIVIEKSWVNTHITHIAKGMRPAIAAKTGYNVGKNHQRGIDISEYAKAIGLEVVEQPPLRKGWSGSDKKITHDELVYFISIDKKRTNQEERDAALLAWHYAGYPIRVKPIQRKA